MNASEIVGEIVLLIFELYHSFHTLTLCFLINSSWRFKGGHWGFLDDTTTVPMLFELHSLTRNHVFFGQQEICSLISAKNSQFESMTMNEGMFCSYEKILFAAINIIHFGKYKPTLLLFYDRDFARLILCHTWTVFRDRAATLVTYILNKFIINI